MSASLAAVKAGTATFEWADIVSERRGFDHRLHITVMRDTLKVDGVRLGATPIETQQIADLLDCMLLTPRVVDLVYKHASIQFDGIVNIAGEIVADCTNEQINAEIDRLIESRGGDDGGIIASVAKYWVLVNELTLPNIVGRFPGSFPACNYGWISKHAPAHRISVTGLYKVWQPKGFTHNYVHVDPSQGIRLMHSIGRLEEIATGNSKSVDLRGIAQDPDLCGLLVQDAKPLRVLRQPGVQMAA